MTDETDLERVQRRTIAALVSAQVVGGVGTGAGLSVGALLVRDVSGSSTLAGLSTTMLVLGAALGALPLAALASARGRRISLTSGWVLSAAGATVVIVGADAGHLALVLLGLLVCGISSATNLQSRYAATDLAAAQDVGRSLSLVVWSTTVGAVLGPNLTGPAGRLAGRYALPALAGPFVFSAAAFAAAAAVMWVTLRPDPLLLARHAAEPSAGGPLARPGRVRGHQLSQAVSTIRTSPEAMTGIVLVASAHAVMVSVMAMTPVQMRDHGSTLTLVGVTISLHIAGMYALSPVMGMLVDRWGWRPTALLGLGTLVVATLVAGTSGRSEVRITTGLVVLGLGWSASLIAGSALVARSVAVDDRANVQGFADLTMNLAGALGGLVAGVVVGRLGFGALNVLAAALTIPALVRVLARDSGRRQPGLPAGLTR